MKPTKIPCRECISFAICNSKVKKLDGVYKTHFIIHALLRQCKLLDTWAYSAARLYQIQTQQIKHFASFYNIRYDIKPDKHLAPTTYLGDTWKNDK